MKTVSEHKLIRDNLDAALRVAYKLGIADMDVDNIYFGQYIPYIKFKGTTGQMEAVHNKIVESVGEHTETEIKIPCISFYWVVDEVSVGISVPMPMPNPEDINPFAN